MFFGSTKHHEILLTMQLLAIAGLLFSTNAVCVHLSDNVGRLEYDHASLINIRDSMTSIQLNSIILSAIPPEMHTTKPRKRGKKAGLRVRCRKRRYRVPLPSIITGNARSLRNKSDELEALVRYDFHYRESCVMCFTETWFTEVDTDDSVSVSGFTLVRSDRTAAAKKSKGGGTCVYINDKYCKDISVVEKYCDPHIELLAITLRPFYLPREIHRVGVIVVYMPPSANYNEAIKKLEEVVDTLEDKLPDAAIIITGDFNQCPKNDMLPSYDQFVDCATREECTLDLLFCNIKSSYRARQLPQLGDSDHFVIHLLPKYRQKLKTQPVKTIKTKVWSPDNIEALQGCFACTQWDIFLQGSMDEAIDVISEYMLFCEDMIVPTKEIQLFPNNKPWVSKDLKLLLTEKKKHLAYKDKEALRKVQNKIRLKVIECKESYKQKIEDMFKSTNTKSAWQGLKTLTGFRKKSSLPESANNEAFANELNEFYARFDKYDFTGSLEPLELDLLAKVDASICITVDQVRSSLRRINPRSASGPDRICGRLLKECSAEVAPVLQKIYQQSVTTHYIPKKWLTSEIIPVPKVSLPKVKNDLRPVALTAIIMKSLERIISKELKAQTPADKAQFAYTKGRSVEDAILTLLHCVTEHTDRPRCSARVLFVDFSSAFNTVQPHILTQKLISMNINSNVILWLMKFLTIRPQYVKFKDSFSSTLTLNTGAPQGCVLSAQLFTIYTSDCQTESPQCHLIKYADDTVIVGLIDKSSLNEDTSAYFNEISKFSSWCDKNYLNLNVNKTKELIIDFGRNFVESQPVIMHGGCVEVVQSYKYLGLIVDNKLCFSENAKRVSKKANQRLYFLRKLKDVNVSCDIRSMFYRSVIQSVATFCIVCYYGNLTKANRKRLAKLQRTAIRLGCYDVKSIEALYTDMLVKKSKSIIEDTCHPLSSHFKLLPSGMRLQSIRCRTNRFLNAFVPTAVRELNS